MTRDVTQTTLVLEPHQIIFRPLVTEKGMHKANRCNAYAFEVSRQAGKADVRRAVEELFEVKVVSVNIQNRKVSAVSNPAQKEAGLFWTKSPYVLHQRFAGLLGRFCREK